MRSLLRAQKIRRARIQGPGFGLIVAVTVGCTDRVAPIESDTTGGTTTGSGAPSTGTEDVPPMSSTASTSTSTAASTGDVGDTTTSASTGAEAVCGLAEADESREVWEAMRDEVSNTYWYVGRRTTTPSKFFPPACVYSTLVVVEQGAVVRRRMQDGQQNGDPSCAAGWDEIGDEVGTHDSLVHGLPAPAWTLDEVYASCCALLSDPPDRDLEPVFYPWGDGWIARCFLAFVGPGTGYTVGPPEWGAEIDIAEIGFGQPPR